MEHMPATCSVSCALRSRSPSSTNAYAHRWRAHGPDPRLCTSFKEKVREIFDVPRISFAVTRCNGDPSPRTRVILDRAPHPARGALFRSVIRRGGVSGEAKLPAIRCPALVVAAKHDVLLPPAQAQLVHRAVPGSRYMLLEDAAHFLPYQASGKFAASCEVAAQTPKDLRNEERKRWPRRAFCWL